MDFTQTDRAKRLSALSMCRLCNKACDSMGKMNARNVILVMIPRIDVTASQVAVVANTSLKTRRENAGFQTGRWPTLWVDFGCEGKDRRVFSCTKHTATRTDSNELENGLTWKVARTCDVASSSRAFDRKMTGTSCATE